MELIDIVNNAWFHSGKALFDSTFYLLFGRKAIRKASKIYGKASKIFPKKQVKCAVKQRFSAVEPRVVYYINELHYQQGCSLQPALQKSNVIYSFSCHCDSRYVGRTSETLQDGINNTSPNLSALALLPRNVYFLPVGANLPSRTIPSFLLLIQPLDFTSHKILFVLSIRMTVDFLFLPETALLLLKPLLSKLLTPLSADKKNSCTAERLCSNKALSLVFFQRNTARLFPINSRSFSCALHSDDSYRQVSDYKIRRYEHLNQSNSQVMYHQSTFQLELSCLLHPSFQLVFDLIVTSQLNLLPIGNHQAEIIIAIKRVLSKISDQRAN